MQQEAAAAKAEQRALGFIDRKFDIIFLVTALFFVVAGMHLTMILFSGDWDFWADWKDRQWWPVIYPFANIIVPAALQYIAWKYLRLPLGATFGAVALILAVWTTRSLNWWGWVYFPIPFVHPSILIPQAILMDLILMWSRSFVVTGILGSFTWGALFYFVNYVTQAQFLQPVEYHGVILTAADVMGFEYVRTQTPEYIRIIEEGTLRAFLQEITLVVAAFAGFACVGSYIFGHLLGRYATWPINVFLKKLY